MLTRYTGGGENKHSVMFYRGSRDLLSMLIRYTRVGGEYKHSAMFYRE